MRQRGRIWGGHLQVGAIALGCLALAGCSSGKLASNLDPRYGVSTSPRVVEYGQPVPKGGGSYRVGVPYVVGGRTYVPEENVQYRSEGIASWYGSDFHGRLTANGEIYDMDGISAAHPTLPMPCYARVTNLNNRRSLIVRINDRGPYAGNREIDLSGKAAELLGFRGNGLARVRVEYAGRAPLEGSDDRLLMATLREDAPAQPPPSVMVASNQPFVSGMASSSPVLRGSIPVPQERPFEFGDTAGVEAQTSTGYRNAALRRDSTRQLLAAKPTAASADLSSPAISTVSAYAPVRFDGTAGATSGRGLY